MQSFISETTYITYASDKAIFKVSVTTVLMNACACSLHTQIQNLCKSAHNSYVLSKIGYYFTFKNKSHSSYFHSTLQIPVQLN